MATTIPGNDRETESMIFKAIEDGNEKEVDKLLKTGKWLYEVPAHTLQARTHARTHP